MIEYLSKTSIGTLNQKRITNSEFRVYDLYILKIFDHLAVRLRSTRFIRESSYQVWKLDDLWLNEIFDYTIINVHQFYGWSAFWFNGTDIFDKEMLQLLKECAWFVLDWFICFQFTKSILEGVWNSWEILLVSKQRMYVYGCH